MATKYDDLPDGVNPAERFGGGVVPSPPDPRDHIVAATQPTPTGGEPTVAPVRASIPHQLPVRLQHEGTCMIFTAIRILENELRLAGFSADLSEAFLAALYKNHTQQTCQDVGSWPRTAMALCQEVGALLESDLTYPQNLCYTVTNQQRELAAYIKGLEYVRANTLEEVLSLIAEGRKVVHCMTLPVNFSTDSDGIILPPDFTPTQNYPNGSLGGHAMVFSDYDREWVDPRGRYKTKGAFTVKVNGRYRGGVENQWSAGWGDEGTMIYPFELFLKNDWTVSPDQGGAWKQDLWTFRGVAAPRLDKKTDPDPDPVKPTRRITLIAQVWAPSTTPGQDWEIRSPIEVSVEIPADSPTWATLVVAKPEGWEYTPFVQLDTPPQQ